MNEVVEEEEEEVCDYCFERVRPLSTDFYAYICIHIHI